MKTNTFVRFITWLMAITLALIAYNTIIYTKPKVYLTRANFNTALEYCSSNGGLMGIEVNKHTFTVICYNKMTVTIKHKE